MQQDLSYSQIVHRHSLARPMFILTKVYEEDFAQAVLQLVSDGGITPGSAPRDATVPSSAARQ